MNTRQIITKSRHTVRNNNNHGDHCCFDNKIVRVREKYSNVAGKSTIINILCHKSICSSSKNKILIRRQSVKYISNEEPRNNHWYQLDQGVNNSHHHNKRLIKHKTLSWLRNSMNHFFWDMSSTKKVKLLTVP